MISINDVDCEYLWTVNGLEFTEDVKEHWNSMDFQERCKYLTTKPDRIEFLPEKYSMIYLYNRKKVTTLKICMTGY